MDAWASFVSKLISPPPITLHRMEHAPRALARAMAEVHYNQEEEEDEYVDQEEEGGHKLKRGD